MVDFDPDDDNIPQKLRNRIISWSTEVPRLQYSQYGPINKYLNLKFPDAMVKPQGLIRPILSEREVQIRVGEDGLVGEDGELDVGNVSGISIDSTGHYVSKQDQKRYPDFLVASYYEDEDEHDKIRLIVEIGSLHKREASLQKNAKKEIQKQLYEYMILLGEEGVRWANNVLGVAILGTEVCFSRPRKGRDGSMSFTQPGKWNTLYDGTFAKEINKLAKMCEEDDSE